MERVLVLWVITLIWLSGCTEEAKSPWHIQTVDSTGDVGEYTSLAVDSSGYPHISYYDDSNAHLKYATWNGSCWDIQVVDNTGRVGHVGQYTVGDTSLALDNSGAPHISYMAHIRQTSYELRYAVRRGSSWDVETVGDTGGLFPSLALDNGDYPHIAYYDSNYDLKYAAWNGSCWDIQTVDSAGRLGSVPSLVLDSSGYPHISYWHHTYSTLKYAVWNGSSWDVQALDNAFSGHSPGWNPSLALDSNGSAHISYPDWTNDNLSYLVWTGSLWHFQTVDSVGDVGYFPSLALDSSGYPHISYLGRDYSDGDDLKEYLKYAVWNGSSWDIETVDSTGHVGRHTSLALDSSGYFHISYYDATNKDLKYATDRP